MDENQLEEMIAQAVIKALTELDLPADVAKAIRVDEADISLTLHGCDLATTARIRLNGALESYRVDLD